MCAAETTGLRALGVLIGLSGLASVLYHNPLADRAGPKAYKFMNRLDVGTVTVTMIAAMVLFVVRALAEGWPFCKRPLVLTTVLFSLASLGVFAATPRGSAHRRSWDPQRGPCSPRDPYLYAHTMWHVLSGTATMLFAVVMTTTCA